MRTDLQCGHHEVTVVTQWLVATSFEFHRGISSEFLTMSLSECLSPSSLSWISLHTECSVTLGTTESEDFAIQSDKHDTMTGINRPRAEITAFNTHFRGSIQRFETVVRCEILRSSRGNAQCLPSIKEMPLESRLYVQLVPTTRRKPRPGGKIEFKFWVSYRNFRLNASVTWVSVAIIY